MAIEGNIETFLGKPVRDFEYGQRIDNGDGTLRVTMATGEVEHGVTAVWELLRARGAFC